MTSFRLSRRASADLSDIHGYVSERNPPTAVKLMGELFDLFHLLAGNSAMGEARNDLRASLRSISHGNYVVFFYPIHDGIEIAAVVHGARDIEALFGPGG